jgi:hypothetical protein
MASLQAQLESEKLTCAHLQAQFDAKQRHCTDIEERLTRVQQELQALRQCSDGR